MAGLLASPVPVATRMMRREERQHLAYHIGRLLSGEGTAAMEWEHFGLKIEVEADSDGTDSAGPP